MKPKLLLVDDMTQKAKDRLAPFVEFVYPDDGDCSDNFTVAYTGLTPIVTNAPVFTPCTGIDHIDAPKVFYLDQYFKDTLGKEITSTAEHTLSLILQIAKKNKMQLSKKKIGIIGGAGRIGKMLSKYCVALDMEVYLYDITCNVNIDMKLKGGAVVRTLTSLDEILPICDIISIHIPLNNDTNKLFNRETIDKMKDGALLINTSRYQIVDESDVIAALSREKLSGYAHDFEIDKHTENGRSYMWIDFETWMPGKIIETPHIGGNCTEARELTDLYIANKILAYIGAKT